MRTALLRALATAAIAAPLALFAPLALADTVTADFENPPYTLGTINVQDGWSSFGAAGSGCAVYDHAVDSSFGVSGFGTQSLRISNAVTSGCFGDQTFSKAVANEAGETTASSSAMSGGTRQNHFEVQYQIASATTTQQPGLFMSSSPDRGDGARMSYVGFDDQADGIHVIFYDYQDLAPFGALATPADGCGAGGDNWIQADIATIDRTSPHTIKLTIDFVDGPRNDVVKVYVDGVLKKTGTSWEDYFRWCTESGGGVVGDANADVSRTVDSMLFRTGGSAVPATAGKGFLIDNLSVMSGPTPPLPGAVHIFKFIDGVQATPANANNVSFPMFTATYNAPFSLNPNGWNPATPDQPYEASTNALSAGAQYTANEDLSTSLVGASCDGAHTYELVGYTTGSSLAAAQLAVPTTTVPTVTIDGDQYIVVWNHLCPPVPTIKVHIVKYLDNTIATAASSSNYQFPMTATWQAANLSGGATSTGNYVLGNFHGGAADQYGADTSPMQVPAHYSTAEITDNIDNSSQVLPTSAQCASGKYRLLGYKTSNTSFADAAAQATSSSASFFNLSSDKWVIVYNETCPTGPVPPPTNACATPGVAPQGWTLQSGTNKKDIVTLAPFTMFVGNGGNDVVTAGDGTYIVCTSGGNDTIKVGNGNSVIDTGAGNDTVKTGNGDMWVSTGNGNDTVATGNGNDTIDLGAGNNSATSGAGNDTVTAGSGNDAVAAGAGTDTCSLGGGSNAMASCEL